MVKGLKKQINGRRRYIVYYHKHGWYDQCWGTPSIFVYAYNKKNAIRCARRRIYKQNPDCKGIDILGCKRWVAPKPIRFDKIIAPIFKKDIRKLRSYNYDIRQILLDNSTNLCKLTEKQG